MAGKEAVAGKETVDKEIAGSAPLGRAATFEEYVAAREAALLRTAMFLVGDRHAGEDLMQDVLERVYRKWHRIDDPDSYVRRAMVNAATSRWRRRAQPPDQRLETVGEGRLPAVPVSETDRFLERERLLGALRKLPPQQRAVLVLRYFDDLSEAETAEIMGCALGTVKTHAWRGLTRLRSLMDESTRTVPAEIAHGTVDSVADGRSAKTSARTTAARSGASAGTGATTRKGQHR